MKHNSHLEPHVWSNISYIIIGIILASLSFVLPGLGLIVLGVSSWMGHLKGGFWWYVDWAGMYISFLSIIAFHLGIEYTWVLWPIILLLTVKFKITSFIIIAILFITSAYLAYDNGANYLLSMIFFTTGLALRQSPEESKQFSEYEQYNLFHSLWHLFTAIGYSMLVL